MTDPTNSRYRYVQFINTDSYRRYIKKVEAKAKIQSSALKAGVSEIPAHGTYGSLLFHPLWKMKREEILKRDRYSCFICNAGDLLQVHHRQYHFVVKDNQFKMPWDYPGHLLITLCESCHKRGHSKFKVPTINI